MLNENLHQILKNEICNDPENLGYIQPDSRNNVVQTARNIEILINLDRDITVIGRKPMFDLMTFLTSNSKQIENIHIITNVINKLPKDSSSTDVLLHTETIEIKNMLNYYGIELFLQSFGVTWLTNNEIILFDQVLKEVLEYLIDYGGDVSIDVYKKKKATVPRINEIFAGIENAPNYITFDDVINTLIEIFA